MSFEPDFLEMFPHVIRVQRKVGQDRYGQPVWGAAHEYPARISGKQLSLRRDATQDVTFIYDIYVHSQGDAMTTEDKYTLPSDPVWGILNPVVFAVSHVSDEDGHHHTKVQCGWQYHRQGQ